MIINNEHNRMNLSVSVAEALEMIGELSKAVDFALKHGHRTTNGMAAIEVVKRDDMLVKGTQHIPSSFNVTVSEPSRG